MSKRIVRLVAFMMMLSMLAACGGGTATTPSATTGAAATTVTEPTTAAEPTTAEAPTTAPAETTGGMMEATATTGGMMEETATTGMMEETATAGMMETTTAGGSMAPVSGQLTLAGSSALLPLMQEAANQFQAKNPDAQITVTAGGSGAGRTQVCEGKIDIGNSDVALSDEEKTNLNCADAVETPVAIQAFAPVANPEGPGSVTNLTKDQVVGIFNGTITNWSEVGGDDQEIVLINRAKGSGTRSNMAKFLFAGDDAQFATGASEEDNSETVRQTVAQTPGAISYLSFAYLQSDELTAFSIDGVAPNVEDIQSGAWKIGGPGYSITKGEPNEIEAAFLAYVTSDEFQNSSAFSTLGFVPVPADSGATTSETATAGAMMEPVSGQLTLAGSSALLPLMQEAANQFQAKNPDAQITVTAGGSGAGRTQVCEGKIDIGNSDVALSDEEKTNLNCADAVETPVAIQAFAPVANPEGPGSVTNLTKDQVVGIFNGTITNWSEVGGDDQEIVLINRAKGSGTRSNMAKFLFAGDDAQFATGASEEDNSETVRQTVAQTPGAISYLSFAYLQSDELTAFSIDGVAPNVEDIQSGAWKIGGPGYSITKGEPNEIEAAFLAYVTSDEFQNSSAFSTLGFVPVSQ